MSAPLAKNPRIKGYVGRILGRHFPGVYARLQGTLRQSDPTHSLSTVWHARPDLSSAASSLHPVLADPCLLKLERPDHLDVELLQTRSSTRDDHLEPVVEMSQMQQNAASVCFVVPLQSGGKDALDRSLQSVLRQTAPDWELLLCGPEDSDVGTWLEVDWRVRRFVSNSEDTGARLLTRAVVQATTRFIGLLSPGDILDDDLIKLMSAKVRELPAADVIYTDEANREADQTIRRPFYKPDWSPEHQHSVNMLGRFVAVRKALVLQSASPESKSDEAAEYELMLSITRRAQNIAHIDEPLYIRATASQQPVGGFFSEPALNEARAALENDVRHENDHARASIATTAAGHRSLHALWPVPADVPITLLILSGMHRRELPGKGVVTLATNFVRSIIEKSSAEQYKIIVVDDGVVDDDLRALLAAHGHSTHTCPKSEPFSFARKANFASSLVSSGIVFLLNDDLEVISPDWIQELAGQAARPAVGAVGCRLLFGDGSLQHAGIGVGFHGSAGHMFHRAAVDGLEYAGFASIDRNYSAVTGAVMAYRKEVFDQVGGFDEQFRTDYNDLDFCLKCVARGLRIVYTPSATLYHFHNSSLKREHDSSPELKAFLARWSHVVKRDPYFSKNFQTQSAELPLIAP